MSVFRLSEASASTELKNEDGTTQTQVATTEASGNAPTDGKGVIKEIYLKGPMGHAYTEILRMLLGKKEGGPDALRSESMQQAVLLQQLEEEVAGLDPIDEKLRRYVYVYDGKTMTLGDVAEMGDAILKARAENKHNVEVVIENCDSFLKSGVNNNQMFDQVLRMAGEAHTPVYFSQQTWLASHHLGGY
jgi:hypothetical protein